MESMPLADGGEGTLDVLSQALGAEIRTVPVHDPLGRPVCARFGIISDITAPVALVETAQACGLPLLSKSERNPLLADTRGVGELLKAAFDAGCRHFLIGLGGSATCDGGAGMLSVPGMKDILRDITVRLLCDVDNPFTGPRGAARVFAPQKGASPEDVQVLEERLEKIAAQMFKETGRDISQAPGAGAAGGLGGAFMAYSDTVTVRGVEEVMTLVGARARTAGADLVITGEGRSDRQTLMGKVPSGVLLMAKEAGAPTVLLSGSVSPEDEPSLKAAGFGIITTVTPPDMPMPDALKPENAMANLRNAASKAVLKWLAER